VIKKDSYFIKEGYQPNSLSKKNNNQKDSPFWNASRISSAIEFQYHVYQEALKILNKNDIKKVLDVGSGPPIKIREIFDCESIEIHLVDRYDVKKIAKKILPLSIFHAADLESINLELNQQYELIICADVIEHLLNPVPCISFIKRHLERNGIIVFSTPERDILRGSECFNCPHMDHVREWNQKEFKQFLEYNGFKIINQQLLPQKRITNLLQQLLKYSSLVGFYPKSFACQMVVCTL